MSNKYKVSIVVITGLSLYFVRRQYRKTTQNANSNKVKRDIISKVKEKQKKLMELSKTVTEKVTRRHIMTHESERTYSEKVEEYLISEYGEANVERNKHLSKTDRYVDFWVDGPVVALAIEVENNFEAVLKGTGQSILYAAHELNAVPVIILPPDHVEQPEADMIRSNVALVEMETPDSQQEE